MFRCQTGSVERNMAVKINFDISSAAGLICAMSHLESQAQSATWQGSCILYSTWLQIRAGPFVRFDATSPPTAASDFSGFDTVAPATQRLFVTQFSVTAHTQQS